MLCYPYSRGTFVSRLGRCVATLLRDFPNHQRVRRGLESILDADALAAYDDAVHATCLCIMKLAAAHLRTAKNPSSVRDNWRLVVSRAYYAAYNASKAVRYLVQGQVAGDVDDHKKVADLPNDFPERVFWTSVLIEMRIDRNIADYEPWPGCLRRLAASPKKAVEYADRFVQTVRSYLKDRGVRV